MSPEYVQKVWHNVNDMSDSVLCENSGQFMNNLLTKLEDLRDNSKSNGNNDIQKEFTNTFKFGTKELILYALGSKNIKNYILS